MISPLLLTEAARGDVAALDRLGALLEGWSEADHPRHPAGGPEGGEFAPKGGMSLGAILSSPPSGKRLPKADIDKAMKRFGGDSAAKAEAVSALARKAGVPYQTANLFIKQWAFSANDSDLRSLAIQRDVAAEFGLELGPWQKKRIEALEKMAAIYQPHAATAEKLDRFYTGGSYTLMAINSGETGKYYVSTKQFAEEAGVTMDELRDFWVDVAGTDTYGSEADDANEFKLFDNRAEMRKIWDERVNETGPEVLKRFGGVRASIVTFPAAILRMMAVGGLGKIARTRPLFDSATQRKMLRAMYENTQAELAHAYGGKSGSIMLYRGTGETPPPPKPINWQTREVRMGPASSWTTSKRIGQGFAAGESLIEAAIPLNRILGMPGFGFGCLAESEVVVLGGGPARVKVRRSWQ